MKKLVSLVALPLFFMSTTASADPLSKGSGYLGGQYSLLTYSEDGINEDAEPTAFTGRIGHFIADRVALESRIGAGLGDDEVRVNTYAGSVDVNVELDSLFGIYAVGHIPLAPSASIYGLIGFTSIEATFSAGGYSASMSDSGLSYGFGAEFYPNQKFSMNVEYAQYLNETGYNLSAVNIGGSFHF